MSFEKEGTSLPKMAKLIFITGGSRSGKSKFAVRLAKQLTNKVTFVATGIPMDGEMRERIRQHQKDRPGHWKVVEEEKNLLLPLSRFDTSCELVIIDCLSFLISNLLIDGAKEKDIIYQVRKITDMAHHSSSIFIIVSNEVGSGVVPPTNLGRRFRDICGRANQIVAKRAQEVYLMVSGIPVKVRSDSININERMNKGVLYEENYSDHRENQAR